MNEKISPLALKCLKQLNDAGYRAYLVGGSVRDLLRGIIPHDYDLCTSALPQETQTVFAADKTVLTGVQHGTVTVIKGGESFEITTFRRKAAILTADTRITFSSLQICIRIFPGVILP